MAAAFGVRALGMLLANYPLPERLRRGMFIEIVAQLCSSSVGATYDRCRSYEALENCLPGSINMPLLRS
jgi:hypothetical protein